MTGTPPELIDQTLPPAADLEALAVAALERVSAASGAAVAVSQSVGLTVSVRGGAVESIEFQRDRDLGVTVYRDQRSGSGSTADWSEASIVEAAQRALDGATFTGEDPYGGLPDADRLATAEEAARDLSLHYPWSISVEGAIEQALACEAAALAADPRIDHCEGATLDTRASIHLLANTHGFSGHSLSTSHSLSCAAIAKADGKMERDAWYTADRNPAKLDSAVSVGREAGERAAARLGATSMPTAQRPVIFAPELARSLIGSFLGAISGGALYRRHSFLLDAMNTVVFPEWLTIAQQPHLPGAAGSSNFDREGVATRDRTLIESGVLRGWLLGSYSARRLGLQTTGNAGGAFNVFVSPDAQRPGLDDDALLAAAGDGVYITEMMGQGVNPTTGDYSRGAAGFAIRGGKLAEPVSEITVAGNLRDMLASIRHVGSREDTRGNVRCGALLIDGMTVAGH